jgi:hypothetical protein
MTSPIDVNPTTTNDILKPKGVISAFNFFIKATRKVVLDEFGSMVNISIISITSLYSINNYSCPIMI